MATITAEVIDGTTGSNAAGLGCYVGHAEGHIILDRCSSGVMINSELITDKNGTISQQINDGLIYEIGFLTGEYWKRKNCNVTLIEERIVFQFVTPDQKGSYRISLTIKPNSYSVEYSDLNLQQHSS